MDRTGPQVHVAPVRCPFCHEGIAKGEPPAVCGECHALHHAACMNEHAACAACGRKSSPEAVVELEPKRGFGVGAFLLFAALGAVAALFLVVFLLLPLTRGPSDAPLGPRVIVGGSGGYLRGPRELADRAVVRAAEAKRLRSTDPAAARRAIEDALSMIDQAIVDLERLLDDHPAGHSEAIEQELDHCNLERVSFYKLSMELER